MNILINVHHLLQKNLHKIYVMMIIVGKVFEKNMQLRLFKEVGENIIDYKKQNQDMMVLIR